MLLLHEIDDIAAKQHLHLCIPVFEKLVQTDLHLVIEQIYQYVDYCFHELEVIQVDRVRVNSIREKIALDCSGASKKCVV